MNPVMNPKLDEIPPAVSPTFTPLQGQYLAFIYAYTCITRRPPAQADMQRHFQVTPLSIHQMVITSGWASSRDSREPQDAASSWSPQKICRSCAKPTRQDLCAKVLAPLRAC